MDVLIMAPNHDNDLPNWNMDDIKIFAYRNETSLLLGLQKQTIKRKPRIWALNDISIVSICICFTFKASLSICILLIHKVVLWARSKFSNKGGKLGLRNTFCAATMYKKIAVMPTVAMLAIINLTKIGIHISHAVCRPRILNLKLKY